MVDAPQYLLMLYTAEWEGDKESPTSPGYVVDTLDRSPPAAAERLQNPDAKGLVDYGPYEGATLTAKGHDAAAGLYNIYQILSRLYWDALGVNNHEGEAMQLVGNISPAIAECLSATLLRDDGGRDGAH